MNKFVNVYMASLPRQNHVIKTAHSILCQPEVATLTILLSKKYSDEDQLLVRQALNYTNVKLYITDDAKGSNEKLRCIGDDNDYYIALCDDDTIYPDGYFAHLISGCENYNAHVSLHGVILAPRPVRSYYADRFVYRGFGNVDNNYEVDVAASCMTLFKRHWHPDINEWYDRCGTTSMDDLYVSLWHKEKGIKRYVLNHPEGWLKHKEQFTEDNYVFNRHTKQLGISDRVQTEFVNLNWK